MIELMTLICLLVVAGFLLFADKKGKAATRAYNSTEMVKESDTLFVQIKKAKDEASLETARQEIERFKLLYATDYEGTNEYEALCVIYNQQRAKLERARRYKVGQNLSSEYLDLDAIQTLYRYDKGKN